MIHKSIKTGIPKFKSVIYIAIGVLLIIVTTGCPADRPIEKTEPIFRDAYLLYILDPGPFVAIDPEYPASKEFLILLAGDVEISCGVLRGAQFGTDDLEDHVPGFANETIVDENFLPGCSIYVLNTSEVTIGDRWYYYVTLLIRRDPAATRLLDRITLITHEREINRFPPNEDRIVRLYYAVRGTSIYIFTLSGTPEDIVYRERDIRRLLASVRLSAIEAVEEIQDTGLE